MPVEDLVLPLAPESELPVWAPPSPQAWVSVPGGLAPVQVLAPSGFWARVRVLARGRVAGRYRGEADWMGALAIRPGPLEWTAGPLRVQRGISMAPGPAQALASVRFRAPVGFWAQAPVGAAPVVTVPVWEQGEVPVWMKGLTQGPVLLWLLL